ncbi:hypothetical protein HK405_016011, partial [Cladochytrium tenue]
SSIDLNGSNELTPYLTQRLSFLAAQSAILLLQSARSLPSNLLGSLSSLLRSRLALTEPCQTPRVSHFFAPSSTRLVYRADLMEVEPCVESGLLSDDVAADAEIMALFSDSIVEFPSIYVVSAKKTKQKIAVVDVRWQEEHVGSHSAEFTLLLHLMKRIREKYGCPVVVGGVFDDDLSRLFDDADDDSLRTWFPPQTDGSALTHIWAPTVPPAPLSTALRHFVPNAEIANEIQECLVPPTDSQSVPDADMYRVCHPVADFARSFRRSLGQGLLSDDRLTVRHEECAANVGSGHLPVSYTLRKGNESYRIVTFKLGGLRGTRIGHLRRSNPGLFAYLASFDIVALQTDSADAGESVAIVDSLLSLLNANASATPQKATFAHASRYLAKDSPSHLHLFVKESSGHLSVLDCASQPYGRSGGGG